MKHPKSSLADLRRVFDSAISIRELAEPLVTFDAERGAAEVRPFLDAHDFDVAGVRRNGRCVGYVARGDLSNGLVADHLKEISASDVVAGTEPMTTAVHRLQDRSALFVSVFGDIAGIVTRGDLQKAPLRMWVFGILSLVEMQMLRLIREHYPDKNLWIPVLRAPRWLKNAEVHFERHSRRNSAIDVAECLGLREKGRIFSNAQLLLPLTQCKTFEEADAFFKELVDLRDDLAHSHDLVKARWKRLPSLLEQTVEFLDRLEQTKPEGVQGCPNRSWTILT